MTSHPQRINHLPYRPGDRRLDLHDTVVDHEADFQSLLFGNRALLFSPRHRDHPRVDLPWRDGCQGRHVCLDRGEAGCHGSGDGADYVLFEAGHTSSISKIAIKYVCLDDCGGYLPPLLIRLPPRRRRQAIQSAQAGRNSDGAAYVGADADDASPRADETRLAAGTPAGDESSVQWVHALSEEVVVGVGHLPPHIRNCTVLYCT